VCGCSGCQGNIIEVFDLQGKQMNSIQVAGRHCGAMTGVLSFQVCLALLYLVVLSTSQPSPAWLAVSRQYDEQWLFAGLHARPPMNSLYILDFSNPTAPAVSDSA
jgi:hypothetical protein